MKIMQKNKARLEYDVTTRKNLDSSLGIYLTSVKVSQCRLVGENSIEK